MQILGASELVADVQSKNLCVHCGACAGVCPYFKSYQGKMALLFSCTQEKGRCHAHCPKTEVDYNLISRALVGRDYDGSPLGFHKKIVKARAGEKVGSTGKFQNGGTVSSIVSWLLKSGGIDAAALTARDGLLPVCRLVTEEDEVLSCASSKYMTAPVLTAVNEAPDEYERIGVVGTPCQLTSLGMMRANPLEIKLPGQRAAFTIGLFCTWAVDTRSFMELVSASIDPVGITGMDVPSPPASVLEIHTENGALELPLDKVRETVSDGCWICPDMTAEFSDISVGALETDRGWNTLVIRTDNGVSVVDEAVKAGWLVVEELPDNGIEALEKAAAAKKRRAIVKASEQGLLNNKTEGERSALLIHGSIVEKITGRGTI